MKTLGAQAHNHIGKSNFSPIVVNDRPGLLEWWEALPDEWQDVSTSGKHSMQLLWLAERGLVTLRSEVQWYPPKRPPYCVLATVEHSGPFMYEMFIESFGRLQCVLPEWRESLRGSDWEVPSVSHVMSNAGKLRDFDTAENWIAAIESLARFDGQNGVTTAKGRSRDEAFAEVQKRRFPFRIVEVKFDGVPVFTLQRNKVVASTHPELSYNMQGLKKIIGGGDNETVRSYLNEASLPIAKGRGTRMNYSFEDAVSFARQAASNPTMKKHQAPAEAWLKANVKTQ